VNERLETRKRELEEAAGRTLRPVVADAPAPISDRDLEFLLAQAEDLFWNELEWEHLTEEEQMEEGTLVEQAFPGFLAFVRGLLLDEVMPDALADATPRPRVVKAILEMLDRELSGFEERLSTGSEEDPARLKGEVAMTSGLIDLVMASLYGLDAEDLDRVRMRDAGS
jgi:hypothetical protein